MKQVVRYMGSLRTLALSLSISLALAVVVYFAAKWLASYFLSSEIDQAAVALLVAYVFTLSVKGPVPS